MEPLRSIAELDYGEQPMRELLHFTSPRAEPDREAYQYGWCRLAEVWLAGKDQATLHRVEDAIVMVAHSSEEPEALADDVELEFWVDAVADDYSITVLLTTFLAAWLPRMPAGPGAIILAICNPHRAHLARRVEVGGTPLWYALGNMDTWLHGGARVVLEAEAWRVA